MMTSLLLMITSTSSSFSLGWTEESCVGACFLSLTVSVKLYSEFINLYDNTMAHLAAQSEKNKKFKAFLDVRRQILHKRKRRKK